MSAEIDSIASGGGSSTDVRYVTFMSYDGLTEVGKLPVAAGYDCPNPKFTATRESTAQYSYTQDGWSTTENGDLDSNALKEVNEDRTVYAHFKATVRTYTITYLDEDGSVLKTESLAYGTMPSYTPEKDGFGFDGWTPALATVTGNASYTAVWAAQITFENASWAQIAEISENGEAENYFAVGDTRTMTLNFSGTTENVLVRIVGFNHDDLSSGTGKAGISIVLAQAITNAAIKVTEKTSYGNCYIWENSAARTLLNSGAVYTALPADLRSVLKRVTKTSNGGYSKDYGGKEKNALYTTTDKVWLLSSTELGLDNAYSADYVALNQGVQYAYYDSNAKRTKKTTTGSAERYPTRSMMNQYNACSFVVNATGGAHYGTLGSTGVGGVFANVFGFCI